MEINIDGSARNHSENVNINGHLLFTPNSSAVFMDKNLSWNYDF
jgi:hypothetical protein